MEILQEGLYMTALNEGTYPLTLINPESGFF